VGPQQSDSPNSSRHPPFPLVVAPPNYGPWRRPRRPVSYLRNDRNSPGKKSKQLQIERFSEESDVSNKPNSREMGVINSIAKHALLSTKVPLCNSEAESQRSSSDPQFIFSHPARDLQFYQSTDDHSKKLSTDKHYHSRSENDLIPSRQNSSIHTLLSRSVHNPLFDDGDDNEDVSYPPNDNLQSMPSKMLIHNAEVDKSEDRANSEAMKRFHSDFSITSWVWAPNDDGTGSESNNRECDDNLNYVSEKRSRNDVKQVSHQRSEIERTLRCTLDLGRAVNADLPLLAAVSSVKHKGEFPIIENDDDGPDLRDMASLTNQNDRNACMSDTNLYLLYKATEVTVRNNARIDSAPSSSNTETGENKEKNGAISMTSSAGTGHYTLYQARHPSLASLIAVKKCKVSEHHESAVHSSNDQNDQSTESIISVFDITPSQHRPLQEWLRTMDADEFLNKPLFPGIEGHTFEPLGDDMTQRIHNTQQQKDEQPQSDTIGVNHDQPSLCQCRRMSNRVISLHRSRQKRSKIRFSAGTSYRADVADLRIRFLAMQLFHAVNFCHSRGITLGDQLRPDRIFVQDDGWIRLVLPIVCDVALCKGCQESETTQALQIDASTNTYSDTVDVPADEMTFTTDRRSIFQKYDHPVAKRGKESIQIIPYPGYGDIPTVQWQKGQITNLSYLMMLNAAAGRIVGDTTCPPILPWVTDFTSEIDLSFESQSLCCVDKSPWRDLSKTKFRLKKGDEQLDHTYLHADPPHHIPETISDLTYTMYRARCLPIHQLRSSVRDTFVPQHYPDSLAKLYKWSPDEATFEFYVTDSDPNIFYSRHAEMPDLSLPPWCENSYERFISYHRSVLESDLVSRHLHLWIDLNFGEALSGERAVKEKNVVLHRVSWDISGDDDDNNCRGDCRTPLKAVRKNNTFRSSFRKSVFVQLFSRPHPKKHSSLRQSISSAFHSGLDDHHQAQEIVENDTEFSNNVEASFRFRTQRDVSMIGAIIQDCYRATRVVPPADVVNAMNELTSGTLDIKQSLKKSDSSYADGFPFPNFAKETYEFLASIQNVEFKRKQMNLNYHDNFDLTLRSSALCRHLSLIRSSHILNKIPESMAGLVMPSIVPSLCSVDTFAENFGSIRSFASMADKMCEFLIALSKRIPAELVVPYLLKFLEASFQIGNCHLTITEALGKIYLSNSLFSSLYSNSCGEYYILWLSSFVTMQLCRCKPGASNPMQETLQMTSVIVFFASFLAQDNLIGPSICCRYIVPYFVENITKSSGFNRVNPVIQALKSLVPYIPEDAIGVLICKPILRNLFPTHLPHYCAAQKSPPNLRRHDKNMPESYDFLNDCIDLLRMCLRCLDSDNIIKYFMKSNSGTIVQILLASLVVEIADKGFNISAPRSSEYPTFDESNDLFEKQPNSLLKETSFLVRDLIGHIDLDSINEVFSTIENYCSRVNDEYSTIAMGLYTNKFNDREKVMALPGVATAVLLAGEMIRVCGREQLKLHCPSALELLAWVNSSEKLVLLQTPTKPLLPSSPEENSTPRAERNVIRETSSFKENTSDKSIDEIERLSLEMRTPIRHNLSNSGNESDDERRSLGSPVQQQMSGESSVTHNISESSMPFERNDNCGSKPHNHAVFTEQDGKAERQRELAWVLGLNRRDKQSKINYSWQPRMMISATLLQCRDSENDRSPITYMATNKPESMLVAGNSNGEILLFDLRRQPPSLKCRNRVDHQFPKNDHSSIRQVDFFDNIDSLLVCNGSLHHWNIETETTITSLSKENAVLNTASHGNSSWLGADFIGFSNFPKGTGTEEMFYGAIGEVAAISTNHLYTIDLRSQNSFAHSHHLTRNDAQTNQHRREPLFKSLTWYRECLPRQEYLHIYKGHGNRRQPKSEPQSFNLTCITTHCGGGDWVCVGSSSGHIHCFDRRQGKLLVCWKAHSKSVEYLKAVSCHRLISASGDKTAVLWDLSHSTPLKVSRIYNIPGKEQAMNVVSHKFRNDGLVSIPGGDLLLCAISGRKAVFQAMPQNSGVVGTMFPENEPVVDVKADRIVMCDYEGNRISSSEKFNISSVALLPCRQLVLLGCDGEIHVCL